MSLNHPIETNITGQGNHFCVALAASAMIHIGLIGIFGFHSAKVAEPFGVGLQTGLVPVLLVGSPESNLNAPAEVVFQMIKPVSVVKEKQPSTTHEPIIHNRVKQVAQTKPESVPQSQKSITANPSSTNSIQPLSLPKLAQVAHTEPLISQSLSSKLPYGQGFGKRTLHGDPRLSQYVRQIQAKLAQSLTYPYRAKKAGIEGIVILGLEIDRWGRLSSIKLDESCQHCSELLAKAAIKTATRAAPFSPPPSDTQGNLYIEVPIAFRLTN